MGEVREELIVVADDLDEALGELGPAGSAGSRPPPARTRVRVLENGAGGASVEVDAATDGWLMLDRAWLPRYRATLDGQPVRPTIANALRLAVPVPAGSHQVEVWYATRSWGQRWWFVGAGLVVLALLASARFLRASPPML